MTNYTSYHEEPPLTPTESRAVLKLAIQLAKADTHGRSVGTISNQIIKDRGMVQLAVQMDEAVQTQASERVEQLANEMADRFFVSNKEALTALAQKKDPTQEKLKRVASNVADQFFEANFTEALAATWQEKLEQARKEEEMNGPKR